MKEVARFFDMEEAQIAAGFLRSHGMDATLADEHALSVMPELRVGLGGFRLLVPDQDEAAATQLLADIRGEAPPLGACANCGHTQMRRVRDARHPFLLGLLGLLFPFAGATNELRCAACGHKQPETDAEDDPMSLHQPYDPENIFAKIIAGDIPAAKVYEDGEILAFMDAFPQSKGHTLVISKTATATNLLEMEAETLSHLMLHTQRIAKSIVAALKPDGFRLVQFNGAPAGQTVFHLHFHIIPVWEGTDLGAHAQKQGTGQADMTDLETIAGLIREQL